MTEDPAGTPRHDTPEPGPGTDLAATAAGALRWMRQRPVTCVTVIAAVAGAILAAALGGQAPEMFIAACIAGGVAWVAMLRFSYGGTTVRRFTVHREGATNRKVRDLLGDPAAPRFPEPPEDTAAAVKIVDDILALLRPAPEKVRAADPDTVEVLWEPKLGDGIRAVPGHRAEKMRHLCALVMGQANRRGVLHQLPLILLVADDGVVMELSNGGRLGTTDDYGSGRPAW